MPGVIRGRWNDLRGAGGRVHVLRGRRQIDTCSRLRPALPRESEASTRVATSV
eukprot:COSAG02_NODE_33775_length_494_cov_3.903797_1_plen_52_part_10